ncbi:MAG: hypothetical protein ACYTE1_05470 [Planctomycetota bacterium]
MTLYDAPSSACGFLLDLIILAMTTGGLYVPTPAYHPSTPIGQIVGVPWHTKLTRPSLLVEAGMQFKKY